MNTGSLPVTVTGDSLMLVKVKEPPEEKDFDFGSHQNPSFFCRISEVLYFYKYDPCHIYKLNNSSDVADKSIDLSISGQQHIKSKHDFNSGQYYLLKLSKRILDKLSVDIDVIRKTNTTNKLFSFEQVSLLSKVLPESEEDPKHKNLFFSTISKAEQNMVFEKGASYECKVQDASTNIPCKIYKPTTKIHTVATRKTPSESSLSGLIEPEPNYNKENNPLLINFENTNSATHPKPPFKKPIEIYKKTDNSATKLCTLA